MSLVTAFGIGLVGCSSDYVPKPKGYHRIDLPAPAYQTLAIDVPYRFRYSTQAIAARDSDRMSEPNWVDLYYPKFDATIELTYKALPGPHTTLMDQLIEDARKLANKHQVKASAIDEQMITTGSGDRAFVFRLKGQVPTQYQFYVTDSSRHYLRGALYFTTATKNDSLAPVIDFISADMDTLLRSLQWRNR